MVIGIRDNERKENIQFIYANDRSEEENDAFNIISKLKREVFLVRIASALKYTFECGNSNQYETNAITYPNTKTNNEVILLLQLIKKEDEIDNGNDDDNNKNNFIFYPGKSWNRTEENNQQLFGELIIRKKTNRNNTNIDFNERWAAHLLLFFRKDNSILHISLYLLLRSLSQDV